jgi:lon-related putative ATP-dependent protease
MCPRKSIKIDLRLQASSGEIPPSALYRSCDPDTLGFKTTDDLPDLEQVIGQPRAVRALQLGSEVPGPGYNIFVLGLPGSGRATLSREYLEHKAAQEPVPVDWCYVNNFENERQPKALCFPAGRGAEFRHEIQELIARAWHDIPGAFESDEFIQERDHIINQLKKDQEAEFGKLQGKVEKDNFFIARTSGGFVLAPAAEGKLLKPEEIQSLSTEHRSRLNELQTKLGKELERTIAKLREQEISSNQELQQLISRTVLFIIRPLNETIKAKYSGQENVLHYLEALQADIIANVSQFRPNQLGENPAALLDRQLWARRYEVNLLGDHTQIKGAPVIVENYPAFTNLIGRIEHDVIMGVSRTDFTMIRPGALHRANGGYLILPARDVLINPYSWDGLKRVLRESEIRIVELASQMGIPSQSTLEPEPIPIKVKIILVGTPTLYYLLRSNDEDFTKLFKVRAEFGTIMERTPENERDYGLFVKSVVLENNLPPFDNTAVARVIEYSSQLADDQGKLSTRFGKIADLVREAAYWAIKDGEKIISAQAVDRAIHEAIFRSNLIEERYHELINQQTLLIDVVGSTVGQINALSVFLLGDYSFGRPTRVTAVTYPGKAGVVDIERQAKLGGALHTKGVLILSGFLNWHYGQEQPLSLSASVTFEQSYEEIQGDSASAAELIALLSAITRAPIRQDRAITGSINQLGQIQAIGGVNEKIEGFYAICKAKGLTGEQGVLIPTNNQRHLMLDQEVVQAVKAGKFHIWAVSNIDEAIQLLTTFQPGECQPDGSYTEGTFNRLVVDRLNEYNKSMQTTPKNSTKTAEPETKENKLESL